MLIDLVERKEILLKEWRNREKKIKKERRSYKEDLRKIEKGKDILTISADRKIVYGLSADEAKKREDILSKMSNCDLLLKQTYKEFHEKESTLDKAICQEISNLIRKGWKISMWENIQMWFHDYHVYIIHPSVYNEFVLISKINNVEEYRSKIKDFLQRYSDKAIELLNVIEIFEDRGELKITPIQWIE